MSAAKTRAPDDEPSAGPTGAEIYDLCRRGDQRGWLAVYNQALGMARWPKWRLAHRAEDAAHDAVLRIMERIGQVRDRNAFRGYIKMVTHSCIIDEHRRTKQRGEISIDPDPEDEGAPPVVPVSADDPGRRAEARDVLERVRRGIAKLPKKDRAILEAYIAYKLGIHQSYAELARFLRVKVGTLGAQINRALARLESQEELLELLGDSE